MKNFSQQAMTKSKVVLIYDDFNIRFPQNQHIIGTITTQFGNPSPRHGCKIIEIYEYEKEDNHQPNTNC